VAVAVGTTWVNDKTHGDGPVRLSVMKDDGNLLRLGGHGVAVAKRDGRQVSDVVFEEISD
jgi:hypothetical protein